MAKKKATTKKQPAKKAAMSKAAKKAPAVKKKTKQAAPKKSAKKVAKKATARRTIPAADPIFGIIGKRAGSIQLREWSEIIASHPALEQFPDREMVNPFTQDRIAAPGAGAAYYLNGGKRVGNLSLEGGEIKTTGVPQEFCEALAIRLHAQFRLADFS